jgi:hypothetical protein
MMVKNGTFYSGKVIYEDFGGHSFFILHGIETTDTTCGGELEFVTISASCSELTPVYYVEEDGDKIGSSTPSNSDKIYHLFAHMIKCI